MRLIQNAFIMTAPACRRGFFCNAVRRRVRRADGRASPSSLRQQRLDNTAPGIACASPATDRTNMHRPSALRPRRPARGKWGKGRMSASPSSLRQQRLDNTAPGIACAPLATDRTNMHRPSALRPRRRTARGKWGKGRMSASPSSLRQQRLDNAAPGIACAPLATDRTNMHRPSALRSRRRPARGKWGKGRMSASPSSAAEAFRQQRIK